MQRRSFFGSLFATAAVTAVAVEAKPAPVALTTETNGVEDELIYHAMIIIGKLKPGRCASPSELELGRDVLQRYLNRINYGVCAPPMTADQVLPVTLADELGPYYQTVTKPAPVVKGTVPIRNMGYYTCEACGCAMIGFYNHTMRCTDPRCQYFEKPIRIPITHGEIVDDTEEVIRHAMIIVGAISPQECLCQADQRLCSEVVARIVREMNKDHVERWPGDPGYTAKDIRPYDLAQELMPYYNVSPRI